jgi:HPt (histidine-containing phosphotransfer) domain-containing protein
MYANKTQWHQALEESLGLESSDLDDLAGVLIQTLPEAIKALESATLFRDELRRHAHSIKGSSGNLGLLQLSKLADELEIMIRKGAIGNQEYYAKVAAIQLEYAAFVRLMRT